VSDTAGPVAGDPLQPLQLAATAGRTALDRVAAAIAVAFGPRARLPANWALALVRLEALGRPVTVGEFQDLCLLDSNASYAIGRLVQAGQLRREPVPDDRRLVQVALTPSAAAWLAALRAALGP
jgi:hypothetical protein